MFSTFPAGRAGIGLLLLRMTLAMTVLVQAAACVESTDHSTIAIWVWSIVAGAGAVALMIGLFTPVPAILVACLVPVLWVVHRTNSSTTTGVLTTLLVAANAVAIALLGPGTFSLDGRLFGRREIIVPPQAPTHHS
jgi:uncharacterized membrane protein YphA (DoxX/SURF4 family)